MTASVRTKKKYQATTKNQGQQQHSIYFRKKNALKTYESLKQLLRKGTKQRSFLNQKPT